MKTPSASRPWRGEEGSGLAALEQHRVARVVAREEADGAVAVPALERVGLLDRISRCG